MSDPRIYFAALPTEELTLALGARIERFYRDYSRHPISAAQADAARAFHGLNLFGQPLNRTIQLSGEKGEIATTQSNLFRELVTRAASIVTGEERPAWVSEAVNRDSASLAAKALSESLLTAYWRNQRLEPLFREAAIQAIRSGEAWVSCTWDSAAGKEFGLHPQTGAVLKEGDLRFALHGTADVIRDSSRTSHHGHQWVILRETACRYDLVAMYPDLADAILAASDAKSYPGDTRPRQDAHSDQVTTWTLYHRPTAACPSGRYTVVLGDMRTVLADGPLPYDGLPVFALRAGEFTGTIWPDSWAFDVLSLQKIHSLALSTILTNLKNAGRSMLVVKPGSNLDKLHLQGQRVFESDDVPQVVELPQLDGAHYQMLQVSEGLAERVSGINSTVRGSPPPQAKSGAAMALLHSTSVQFLTPMVAAFSDLLGDVGTAAIRTLTAYVQAPRVQAITGRAQEYLLRRYQGQDLQAIDRVAVSRGSPYAQSQAGRAEMLDYLLKLPNSPIKSPDDVIHVLTYGRLDAAASLSDAQQHDLQIRAENEALSAGQNPPALALDNHLIHIQRHLVEASNPAARQDPAKLDALNQHISDHLRLWRSTPPEVLAIIGLDPLAPVQPQPTQPTQPVLPAGPTSPPPPEPAPTEEFLGVAGPRMPVNPLTGNDFDPATGGL